MISRCSSDWSIDELRSRCENAPSKFSYLVEDYVPVVAEDFFTYRNKFCALSNGVKNYNSWEIYVETETFLTPPKEFDLSAKLKFIQNNGEIIYDIWSAKVQPRICFGKNYIDNCSLTTVNASLHKACLEGPVEVVPQKQCTMLTNISVALFLKAFLQLVA